MFEITKDFAFAAAHSLPSLPSDHKCHRLHGHNYVVRLTLAAADLDAHGFVLDYGELSEFKRWIDDRIDHRFLNEIVPVQTSAENLAKWIFDKWKVRYPLLVAVSVSETPKVWATYRSFE